MIYVYAADAAAIRQRLTEGAALVACLCTEHCHRCDDWWGEFRDLADEFPDACFVWLDVNEHPDMIADIPGITAYPFLLVQTTAVRLLEATPPDSSVVRGLLHRHLAADAPAPEPPIPEPGLYSFLLD